MAFNHVLSVPMTMAPASLTHAIAFLTRPLVPALAPTKLALLRAVLRTTLEAAYVPTRASRLVLSFIPDTFPPRPISAACFLADVSCVAWMNLLVARRFDLVIEPRVITVEYPFAGFAAPRSVIVWSAASDVPQPIARRVAVGKTMVDGPAEELHVPISKLSQQQARPQAARLRETLHSAMARAQTRTLAQQLLESDEKEEADELFAMISKSILSPTPTRERFPVGISTACASPLSVSTSAAAPSTSASSPLSSRPSSRSSTFSFSSDDEASITSASSVASFDFLDSTKPAAVPTLTITPPRAPVFVPRRAAASAPAHAPAPALAPAAASRVVVDSNKKDVTKYLYQGGVSTVLTGGVMLGGGRPAAKAAPVAAPAPPKATAEPKYRAPIGSGRWGAAQNNASATSWRRAAAARV